MPSRERVQALISSVERGEFMQALREFYHQDAALQENDESPRVGLDACLDHEAQFLALVETFHESRAVSSVIDGDRVAIRWAFDLTTKEGERIRRDEIAYQRWEGDRIVCERFYYDPKAPSVMPSGDAVDEVWENRVVACTIVDAEGRVTLPAAMCRHYAIRPGDRLLVMDTPDGLGLWAWEAAAARRCLAEVTSARGLPDEVFA